MTKQPAAGQGLIGDALDYLMPQLSMRGYREFSATTIRMLVYGDNDCQARRLAGNERRRVMPENRVSDERLQQLVKLASYGSERRYAYEELQHYRAVMKGVEAMLVSGSQVMLSVGLGGRYEASTRDGQHLQAIGRSDIFTAIDELVKAQ